MRSLSCTPSPRNTAGRTSWPPRSQTSPPALSKLTFLSLASHPFDTVRSPLGYSGNPGVKPRVFSQGFVLEQVCDEPASPGSWAGCANTCKAVRAGTAAARCEVSERAGGRLGMLNKHRTSERSVSVIQERAIGRAFWHFHTALPVRIHAVCVWCVLQGGGVCAWDRWLQVTTSMGQLTTAVQNRSLGPPLTPTDVGERASERATPLSLRPHTLYTRTPYLTGRVCVCVCRHIHGADQLHGELRQAVLRLPPLVLQGHSTGERASERASYVRCMTHRVIHRVWTETPRSLAHRTVPCMSQLYGPTVPDTPCRHVACG